jgi:hypothetical protein
MTKYVLVFSKNNVRMTEDFDSYADAQQRFYDISKDGCSFIRIEQIDESRQLLVE